MIGGPHTSVVPVVRHDHGRDDGGPGGELPRGYGPCGEATPGGLSVSADGLLLSPSETRVRPGTAREWTYRVLDDAGTAVTDFFEVHDAMALLILVRRDLVGFQHLHPQLDEDGTWRVAGLTIPDPGVYRAFLDVAAGGHSTTLGYGLFAPGECSSPRHARVRPDGRKPASTRWNC